MDRKPEPPRRSQQSNGLQRHHRNEVSSTHTEAEWFCQMLHRPRQLSLLLDIPRGRYRPQQACGATHVRDRAPRIWLPRVWRSTATPRSSPFACADITKKEVLAVTKQKRRSSKERRLVRLSSRQQEESELPVSPGNAARRQSARLGAALHHLAPARATRTTDRVCSS